MFPYSEDDFVYLEQDFKNSSNSRLDNMLEAAFTKAMDAGMLRYRQVTRAFTNSNIISLGIILFEEKLRKIYFCT